MKIIKTELKWASIYVAVTVAWSLIAKSLGFHDSRIAAGTIFNTLIIIPSIIIYVLSMREKKTEHYDGNASYIQIFKCGLMLTVFVTILGPVYPIFTTLISPDFLDNSIRFMVTSNQMNEADAEKQFTLANFIVQGLIASTIFGLIYSAIISIFLKSKSRTSTNS